MDFPVGQSLAIILTRANYLSKACGISVSVFDFLTRGFVPGASCLFCETCLFAAEEKCNFQTTHLYGCFESDRWSGQYIYFCPMGLAFVATTVYEQKQPFYGIVSGPMVMGSVSDGLQDMAQADDAMLTLPNYTPEQVTALAQTQWALSMFLSRREAVEAQTADKTQFQLLNSLYDATNQLRMGKAFYYPLEIEHKLHRMIVQGDKEGARELINQLLGHLYFNSDGNFEVIKEKAQELVIIFSRAAIEGGADVQQIFGKNRDILAEIKHFNTLDELSGFLTATFYRFVGYVFDFSHIEHTNIIHKTVNYIREHHTEKITLEDVADHVYLSKSYLSKIIKDDLGFSFTDLVNNIRVGKSKELLLNLTLSLAEIADLVGFNDQSYFTKIFSKSTGLSPGQYRKKKGQ